MRGDTVGSYTVIADAGRSLVSLLQKNMIPEPLQKPEDIGLCTPDEPGNARLGLFLYDIEEVPESRNRERIELDKEHYRNPPTSLYLYYMLFVRMESEIANRAVDEQRILGRAIQVLNDYNRMAAEDLQGTLKENGENLDIQGLVLPFEEKHKVYSLFQQKGLHSFFYKVGPVFLDAARIRRIQRVTEAKIDIQQKARGHR